MKVQQICARSSLNYTETFLNLVNKYVYMAQVQVQVRMPEKLVKELDKLVAAKIAKSRSDAVKMIVALYHEREKTLKFLRMLLKRSEEARKKPELLVKLEDIK